jgi:hypothetical protein
MQGVGTHHGGGQLSSKLTARLQHSHPATTPPPLPHGAIEILPICTDCSVSSGRFPAKGSRE